jgi:hypothetical protein
MKHAILIWALAAGILWTAAVIADEIPDSTQTYILRYAPKAGDSISYDMVMDGTIDMAGIPSAPAEMDMKMTFGMGMETLTVDPKGVFTTKVRLDKMDLSVMGMDMDLLAMMPGGGNIEFTMVQEPTGKVVRIEGLDKLAGMGGMGNMPGMDKLQQLMNPITSMSLAIFPDRPLRLWEMWTPELPEMLAGLFEGSGGPPVRCWLCRIEDVDGQKCAKIRTRLLGTMDVAKAIKAVAGDSTPVPGLEGLQMDLGMDTNVYSWMRLSDGKLTKMDGTGDLDINMASGGLVDDSTPIAPGGMPGKLSLKMHYTLTMNPRPAK